MSSTDNPYRPPSATVADVQDAAPDPGFGVPGASVDAGRGVSWIGEGWTLFKAAPVMWILAMVIFLALQSLANLLPIIGSVAAMLLGPLFMAGILAFGHGVARGEPADLGLLFIGFREKTGALVTVGLLYLAFFVGLAVVFVGAAFFVVGGAAVLATAGSPDQVMSSLLAGGGVFAFLLLFLVAFGVLMLLAAAYWFAPGLVLYTDLEPWPAMKESFRVCMHNWLAFLVYGIVGFLVLLGGMLVLFIGMLLVSLPLLMASYYASFRDIFGRKA